jgi:acetyl-CoA C-acetyltransferase
MAELFIISAVRTPIGKFGGSLLPLTAADMGVVATKAALERAGVRPEQVGESIFGNARQAGGGPNPARQISVRSGVPETVPAYTVNMACASSMKSIVLGAQEIATGQLACVLAGGTESMSRLPYYLDGARWGYRLGNQEILAEQYKISRDEQDQYALCSQQRAERAQSSGRFQAEIVPVTLDSKKGPLVFDRDEHIFLGASLEKMAKLPPVFSKTGSITAANSSGITDGAAAVVVASERFVRENNLKPLARIIGATSVGVDPRTMGIGPVPAMKKLEEQTGLRVGDYDLIELNEAFAAQVLACDRELHFDRDKLNVNGGAIALGHPIGCTGARITVTLVHEMLKRKAKKGVATLCVSGGLGMALGLENVA